MSADTAKPCIICIAITGSLPRKAHNPAVPISVAERVESAHDAFEGGARIVHAHVSNEDETPTSDPERFACLLGGLRRHVPQMIAQFSTGGRSGAGHERGGNAADQARHGVADRRLHQRPDPRLREQPRSGGLAGLRDAELRHQARDRGFRPQPHLQAVHMAQDQRLRAALTCSL